MLRLVLIEMIEYFNERLRKEHMHLLPSLLLNILEDSRPYTQEKKYPNNKGKSKTAFDYG